MKLRYSKKKTVRVIYPFDLLVKEGTEIETTDKQEQKQLKKLGFHEVKQEKGGDK